MVVKGLREGRDEQVEEGDFQGREASLCDTVMMDVCHYTFKKTHRMGPLM